MKPKQILFFLVSLFVLMGLVSMVFPSEGIQITKDYTLDYPKLSELFALDTVEEKDFTAIIQESFDIDSVELKANQTRDSLRQAFKADSLRKWQLQLHYPNNDKKILFSLFKKLENNPSKKPIRIMHYGDSQIEGDRISGYLRHKLQGKFGGSGPGLIPAVPLVRSAGFRYSSSENWKRYTLYGKVDTTVTHKKYGAMGTFGRYTEILADSLLTDSLMRDTTRNKAWITIEKTSIGYSQARKFNNYELLFGNFKKPLEIEIWAEDSLIKRKAFAPTESMQIMKGRLSYFPKNITFRFNGGDSPDVYAINLEGNNGVSVDNIAWRGSAGTIFRKMDYSLLAQSLKNFNTQLMILQFGGNVMPYIKSEKECENYGRWFEAQVRTLKTILPDVSLIVIGPSDMGVMENNTYTSYPLLPKVRDELKAAIHRQGGVYWDMMEAMGGPNSMEAWVTANPSLAGKDYVHFNLRGAEKVAQMFYNALIKDYNEYKEATN